MQKLSVQKLKRKPLNWLIAFGLGAAVFTRDIQRGEEIATKYLLEKGFSIIERNYLCKIGEIDIISHEKNSLIFIEVKSKKVKSFSEVKDLYYKPEDNMSYKNKIGCIAPDKIK